MKVKYASIVPLIGGQTMGMEKVWGGKPEWFASYPGFQDNDQHARAYYPDTPYTILGESDVVSLPAVDVVSTTCPCAGLSSLSPSASSDSSTNDWMLTSAEFILGNVKPKVFWGENAPRLATKMGRPTVEKLRKIGKRLGYSFSLYKTKSKFHGLPQVRDRSFYFFWKDETPLMRYFRRDSAPLDKVIREANQKDDPMSDFIPNKNKPTDDPLYRFVLEVIEGGITHAKFQRKIEESINTMDYIESKGLSYNLVADWLDEQGFEKQAERCRRIQKKLDAGGSIMRKTVTVPKNIIGAFVGHFPMMLTHPSKNRYISVREALEIMSMPKDFQLQGNPKKNLNHICQNVPVTTAADMSEDIDLYLKGELPLFGDAFISVDNRNCTYEIVESDTPSLDDFIG